VSWFVVNAREETWRRRPGRGHSLRLTEHSAMLGVNLFVLGPGEPLGMYHWEADEEDFLVLSGEATLLIEGEEHALRQWDFVHCPPETKHIIVGGPCVVLAVGSRLHGDENVNGGAYVVDELALRHGAGVEEETSDPKQAYARFPEPEKVPYPDGMLPSS
jgi:uncharacterized cupin superfamily protein